MFSWWGNQVVRWRWWVLSAGLAFVVFAGLWGTSVFGSLVGGGFDNSRSESARAASVIATDLGRNTADIVVLVSNPAVTVDDPAFQQAVTQAEAGLPRDDVRRVASYWSTNSPAFVSNDRHATYLAITATDPDANIDLAAFDPIKEEAARAGYTVLIGGPQPLNAEITHQVSSDIARAKSVSMPILPFSCSCSAAWSRLCCHLRLVASRSSEPSRPSRSSVS